MENKIKMPYATHGVITALVAVILRGASVI